MQNEKLVELLGKKRKKKRINAIKKFAKENYSGGFGSSASSGFHFAFRSIYSGADKSPSLCVYHAKKFGIPVAALIDYCTLDGVTEFYKAEDSLGGVYFCGTEVKVNALGEKRSLLAVGIPHGSEKRFGKEMKPFYDSRLKRAKNALSYLAEKCAEKGIKTDERAGKKVSSEEEAYMLFAETVVKALSCEEDVKRFLVGSFGAEETDERLNILSDFSNPLYISDLAEITASLVPESEISEPLENYSRFSLLADKYNSICLLVYNGEGAENAVKKAADLAAKGIAVDPEKYGEETAAEIYDACEKADLIAIAVSTVSSPRKKFDFSFKDKSLAKKFLVNSLAIAGHEIAASINPADGLFSPSQSARTDTFAEKIRLFSRIGSKGLPL